ncbi:MAG: hypothetical protein JWO10_811, partial [Microbacteriaceae bacterium]|nr:hypothetical protein [Microbacteriaceae bacterium]
MTATPASSTGVTLLWLEPTRSGSAARTHLDGTRQRLRASGISVLTTITSEARGSNPVARARRLLSLVRQARARANGGVLVARWHPFLAFVSPLWLRRRGQVLLLVQGNDESAYEANPWLRRVPGARKLMQTSVVTASRIIVVTEGLIPWVQASISRAATTERFGTTIEVMPTGVADVFFDTAPREGLGEYVLYFGSLAPWQGIDYMLEAHASSEWPAGLKLIV